MRDLSIGVESRAAKPACTSSTMRPPLPRLLLHRLGPDLAQQLAAHAAAVAARGGTFVYREAEIKEAVCIATQ
jgi:hypothetical protein